MTMTSLGHIDDLKVDARHHRDRRDLYRAKMYGPRPASLDRLRELERACALSESRLRRAEQELEELEAETARRQAQG
jgi:hypothetical protein